MLKESLKKRLNKEVLKKGLQLYLSNALIYGLAILLFRYQTYYKNLLTPQTQQTLLYLYFGFLILSPIYYTLFTKKDSKNKSLLFLTGIKRLIIKFKLKNKIKLEREEKVAFLFILVKLFYLPLMINFFHTNFESLLYQINNFYWYSLILTLLFTVDTLVFSFGYTFEMKSLKNVVKSVEPTILGWAVALICYPPFNIFVGKYIPWGANDYNQFWIPTIDIIMKITIIFLFVIFVWASFALGPKASNLTNRGIVTRFPYSIVRHPAYISKNLVWWLTLIPFITWQFALGLAFWTLIYFLRAVTEERHLLKNPDYVNYCRKVKYKFIPFVY